MERDFMGLNCKDPLVVVKEEAVEGCKDSVQWPLPNNVSALPHFMPSKAAQEEKPTKAGTMATSTVDAFDTICKPPSGEIQSFAGVMMKHRLSGGVPVKPPHSVFPSHGSIAGTTAPWFSSNSSGTPAQLTIFYGGTVNVYNDISPEKAQAILLLAGNVMNKDQTRAQIHISSPRKEEGDNVQPNNNGRPGNGIPSPVSISSPLVGWPNNNCEVKPTGGSASATANFEPPKKVSSVGSLAATAMIQSAIPQSRKASLARFLEKRKERALNSAPYVCKKSSEIGTPISDGATSSVSISTGKENS